MEAKFSPKVKDLIRLSREEAVRLQNEFVSPEHLLLAIIKLNDGKAFKLLKEFEVSFEVLVQELEKVLGVSASKSTYVPPTTTYKGQFRKGYVRKSVSTNPNAIRNQSKSKYY
ncbi:MAG: Clp protease N-terminal domain-containing protein, partial [Flavobacteriales bacterium]